MEERGTPSGLVARSRETNQPGESPSWEAFTQRVLVTVGIVVLVVLVLWLLWYTIQPLLLIFAGVLLGLFLRSLSALLSEYTAIRNGGALAIVVGVIVTILGAALYFLASRISAQTVQLVEALPRAIQHLEQGLAHSDIGRWLLATMPPFSQLLSQGNTVTQVTSFFSSTLGMLVGVFVIVFVGLYTAIQPSLYFEGIIRLAPIQRRARARATLLAVGQTLRWWLLAQAVDMLVVGVLTAVGLWLLGVPLVLTFGLLAMLLDFIPYLGAVLAGIPPTLIVLVQEPIRALYMIVLFVGIHGLEAYLMAPLLQRRTVYLPPALTISAQLLLGSLVGIMGVALATPLSAAAFVLVRMLYLEDVLGETVRGPEEPTMTSGR